MSNFRDDRFSAKNRKSVITPKSNGIGYFIPSTISSEEWKRTKSHWEKKLRNSGFTDIECPAKDHSGFFSPYLINNSIEKNRNNKNLGIMAAYEGYFNYVGSFYALFDFRTLTNYRSLGRRYGLAREFIRLHAAGVSYIDITKAMVGVQTSYMKRFGIKPVQRRYREKRSKYWCFTFMSKILEIMWLWHATDEQGSLTPYDLKHMEVTGITAESFDKAMALLKSKPCARLTEVDEAS